MRKLGVALTSIPKDTTKEHFTNTGGFVSKSKENLKIDDL